MPLLGSVISSAVIGCKFSTKLKKYPLFKGLLIGRYSLRLAHAGSKGVDKISDSSAR
jgi:hypothetical protein